MPSTGPLTRQDFFPDSARVAAAHRDGIAAAHETLSRSERGRKVLGDLLTLLEGPISSLDEPGWESVFCLLECYRGGYPGSVLETLRP